MNAGLISESNKPRTYYEYTEFVRKTSGVELLIAQDVTRTLPTLDYFKTGREGYKKLFHILKCMSLKFPSVGYCQGMNFVAALALLFIGDEIVYSIQLWHRKHTR